MLKTQSQDYLIDFTGAGTTTELGTVKVINLTSGAIVTLNRGEILHLTATAGISNLATDRGTIHVYPNPMAEQSMVTLFKALHEIHKHSSGNPSPFDADKLITEKLVNGAKLLKIPIIDHIIIANNQFTSFQDKKFIVNLIG